MDWSCGKKPGLNWITKLILPRSSNYCTPTLRKLKRAGKASMKHWHRKVVPLVM
ncbi:Protein involved together with Dck1p and Rac1p in invasive filamentous growth and cell wall integrity [Candida albicans P75063]|nr:Protein involved together with Dck1p and Rac1p in invasive filamentous growth and cell wall integrity [Candida albicans P75063]